MDTLHPFVESEECGSHDILALPVGSPAASAELRCKPLTDMFACPPFFNVTV